MIIGIVSIPAAVLIAILGALIGVGAIVLGAIAHRSSTHRPRAVVAIITGAVGVIVGIINSIFGALLMSGRLHL